MKTNPTNAEHTDGYMTQQTEKPSEWQEGKCRVPMWMMGLPAGFCGERAFGPQLPRLVLANRDSRYLLDRPPHCHGHCCPTHGGPKEGEPIFFQDGYTEEGRPMYCAVMPGFVNLQESPAGFSGNPFQALANLRKAEASHV